MQKILKILMLEDDSSDAELIKKFLDRSSLRFEAVVVSDKKEFTEAFSKQVFDVVLADHSLPQFNSVEALKAVRDKDEHVPFILVTGTVSEEFAVRIIQEGADDYILKANLRRLPTSIERALDKKRIKAEKESAEKELLEKNDFLSLMIESLPTIFFSIEVKDDEFSLVYISPNTKGITGFDHTQFSSPFWASRVHPLDIKNLILNRKKILETGFFEGEYRWLVSDGSYKWFYEKLRLVYKPNGQKLLVGAWTDITDKKKSEESLSKSEARNEALLNAIPDILFVIDKRGVFLDYKVDDERDLFAPPYTFLGKKVADVMPPDITSGIMGKIVSVIDTKRITSFEYKLNVRDEDRTYEARFAPFHDDRVLVMVRDITERRISESAADKERKFRDVVVQNMNAGVLATDEKGKITLINETAHKMFRLPDSASDMRGLTSQFDIFTADGKTKLDLNDLPLMRAIQKEVINHFEILMINKYDGRKTHLVTNAQPIYDHSGKMIGAISASHDITNLKITEEKLKMKIHELDAFIYHTTHDLRGPLTSILGLVAVARREVDDKKTNLFLDKFDKTAIKLDNILNDLVSVTKITRNTANFTKIHLDTLIPALLKRVDTKVGTSEVKFNIDVPSKHQFLSDRYLIRSILQSIFENSIQYRNPEMNTIVNISVKNINDFVRVQVSDNGQGIPEDIQDKIFDMFYKGNYSSTGSGLGLYIARVAVEKLGGSISVSSNYGQGTTISMYLPALNDSQIERLLNERIDS